MSDHTPGPWSAEHHDGTMGSIWEISAPGHPWLAEIDTGPREGDEANARLITAAPELLAYAECEEALRRYLKSGSEADRDEVTAVWGRHGYTGTSRFLDMSFPCTLRQRALAKAKGGNA